MVLSSAGHALQSDEQSRREIHQLAWWVQEIRQQNTRMSRGIEALRDRLTRTQRFVYSRLGGYYIKLEQLDLEIRKSCYRLGLREESRLDEEELNRLVEERFRSEEKRIDRMHDEAESVSRAPPKRNGELGPEERAEAKELYRRLAQRFHPDRHQEASRPRYERFMARINDAYRRGDLQALRDIHEGVSITLFEVEEAALQREHLARILNRLESIRLDLRAEGMRLEAHELNELAGELDGAGANPEELIGRMEGVLQRRLRERRLHLEDLRERLSA